MKNNYILIFILSSLIIFTSCDIALKSKAEKNAYEFIKNYFTYYDAEKIIDYESYEKLKNEFSERFKPLMTEKAYRSFISNTDPYRIFDIAAKGRAVIEIKNITLKLKEEYKEDNSLYYEYTGDIVITPLGAIKPKNNSANIVGEIMLQKENDTYKITHFIMRGTTEWFELIKNYESVLT